MGLPATVPEEFSAGDSAVYHLILPPRAECCKCLLVVLRKLILKSLKNLFTQPRTHWGTTYPAIHPPLYPSSSYLSICLSIYPIVCSSIHPSSVYLSIHPSICISIYLLIYPLVHTSITCPPTYLSIYPFISLSIYAYIHPHTHSSRAGATLGPAWPPK